MFIALLDEQSFQLISQALEDNKVLVLFLSALLVFLTIRFVHNCILGSDEITQPEQNETVDELKNSESTKPVKEDDSSNKSVIDDRTLIDAFQNARPPQDPIHGFMSGERDKVPFMCPFFEAFKMAQKRAEKEKEEEEFIAKSQGKQLAEKKPAELEKHLKKTSIVPAEQKKSKSTPSKDEIITPVLKENISDAALNPNSIESGDEQAADLKNVIGNVPFNHLPGCLKRQEHGKLFSVLSEEEKDREQQAVNQQLSEIYALLAQQREAMGDTSMEDVEDQLKLYPH